MEYIDLYTRLDRFWSSVLVPLVSGQWDRSSGFSGGESLRLEETNPAFRVSRDPAHQAEDSPSGSVGGVER
ncbi:uncharacterized protein N7529_000577 [Penicillium soppii]|jgi:hypothetical protein|uniref:uncharacterized protein n=1 Tax=Penicillium soppii TaxID=69789 RepID=UPI002548DBE4|nr:uncharacterized protein N7529_000577 [Penicillium soppii]KAJ5881905.1 hypothetical protein N7529_000577 [Penicillium soppii]